jgi:hypothetical protein
MCVNSRSSLSRRKLATGPRSSCSGPAGARRRVCDVSEHEGACHVLGGGKADELQEACGDDGIRESGAGGVKNEGYDERQHHLAKRGGDLQTAARAGRSKTGEGARRGGRRTTKKFVIWPETVTTRSAWVMTLGKMGAMQRPKAQAAAHESEDEGAARNRMAEATEPTIVAVSSRLGEKMIDAGIAISLPSARHPQKLELSSRAAWGLKWRTRTP